MWVIFRLNTFKTLKRQYTLLSVNVDISIYKFITNYRLQYVLKYLLKVSIKLNGGVVV